MLGLYESNGTYSSCRIPLEGVSYEVLWATEGGGVFSHITNLPKIDSKPICSSEPSVTMFWQYQLQATSGSSGHSPASRPGSSGTSSRVSAPTSRHLSSAEARGSTSAAVFAGFGSEPPPSSQPRRCASSESFSDVEESISAGVRRRRNSEDHGNSHSDQLSPRRTK